ncbi:hypothetical protein ACJ73_04563 [Blastomyces percursus]|uniref:Extracellular membrane protein CFEM domain-containing protein n=1 Tax=Blastomyces percursus TaxID=1658174 RepID=A0A1J9QV12_9EURO|nr:hypothetical protein ACJ73_04563 [Blastomyces percursus]
MRKQRWVAYLVLAYRAPTVIAISLDQIQPIISFPPSCTRVYTSEISDCTVRDFANGGSCSPECVESLEALTRSLNAACVGTRAFSTALIGLFFQGLGVQALCPNSGGTGGGGREIESSAPANPPDIPPVTESRRPPPTQTQTEEPSSTTTQRLAPSTTSTNARSTSTTSDSYVMPSLPRSTTASDPTSTRTTSEPFATTTKTTGPNDDPFGGFGNAFDIIAPNQAASTSQPRKLAIGIVGAAVLLSDAQNGRSVAAYAAELVAQAKQCGFADNPDILSCKSGATWTFRSCLYKQPSPGTFVEAFVQELTRKESNWADRAYLLQGRFPARYGNNPSRYQIMELGKTLVNQDRRYRGYGPSNQERRFIPYENVNRDTRPAPQNPYTYDNPRQSLPATAPQKFLPATAANFEDPNHLPNNRQQHPSNANFGDINRQGNYHQQYAKHCQDAKAVITVRPKRHHQPARSVFASVKVALLPHSGARVPIRLRNEQNLPADRDYLFEPGRNDITAYVHAIDATLPYIRVENKTNEEVVIPRPAKLGFFKEYDHADIWHVEAIALPRPPSYTEKHTVANERFATLIEEFADVFTGTGGIVNIPKEEWMLVHIKPGPKIPKNVVVYLLGKSGQRILDENFDKLH